MSVFSTDPSTSNGQQIYQMRVEEERPTDEAYKKISQKISNFVETLLIMKYTFGMSITQRECQKATFMAQHIFNSKKSFYQSFKEAFRENLIKEFMERPERNETLGVLAPETYNNIRDYLRLSASGKTKTTLFEFLKEKRTNIDVDFARGLSEAFKEYYKKESLNFNLIIYLKFLFTYQITKYITKFYVTNFIRNLLDAIRNTKNTEDKKIKNAKKVLQIITTTFSGYVAGLKSVLKAENFSKVVVDQEQIPKLRNMRLDEFKNQIEKHILKENPDNLFSNLSEYLLNNFLPTPGTHEKILKIGTFSSWQPVTKSSKTAKKIAYFIVFLPCYLIGHLFKTIEGIVNQKIKEKIKKIRDDNISSWKNIIEETIQIKLSGNSFRYHLFEFLIKRIEELKEINFEKTIIPAVDQEIQEFSELILAFRDEKMATSNESENTSYLEQGVNLVLTGVSYVSGGKNSNIDSIVTGQINKLFSAASLQKLVYCMLRHENFSYCFENILKGIFDIAKLVFEPFEEKKDNELNQKKDDFIQALDTLIDKKFSIIAAAGIKNNLQRKYYPLILTMIAEDSSLLGTALAYCSMKNITREGPSSSNS